MHLLADGERHAPAEDGVPGAGHRPAVSGLVRLGQADVDPRRAAEVRVGREREPEQVVGLLEGEYVLGQRVLEPLSEGEDEGVRWPSAAELEQAPLLPGTPCLQTHLWIGAKSGA